MRLLFFFSDTGGGHRAAADAVRDALQRRESDQPDIVLIDFFKALPWPFLHFPILWPTMIGLGGIPWGLFYRLTDHRSVAGFLARLVWPYIAPALRALLARHTADVIVSFHPVINDVLSIAKRELDTAPPLISVSQDLVNVHAATFAPNFAQHVVPTDAARARALHWNVTPSQVKVVGVPTRSHFVELMKLPQREARARLNLPLMGDIVLFAGGSDGIGPFVRAIRAFTQHPSDQTPPLLIAITGRNDPLYRQLKALEHTHRLHVVGYAQNMALWMRAADLLVTKAGPNTLAEAFIAGCPLVLYDAIPGQETGNVRYVVDGGAGLWAPRPARAAESIQLLLNAPARRRAMAAHARDLARPHAAAQIADIIQSLSQ